MAVNVSVRSGRRRQVLLGLAFIAPVLLMFGWLVFYPMARGIGMSMQALNYSVGATGRFTGLVNYFSVLADSATRGAFAHTVGYTVCAVLIEIVGGMAVALAMRRTFRGRGVVLALLVLPWALPKVVGGLLWSRIFATDNGLLNAVLAQVGVIHTNHAWFADQVTAIILISCVHAWGVLPLTSLIMLAGLQGIPREIYAAAELDGAGKWRQFTRITLPLTRPSIAVALTVGSTTVLALFDEIYVLNGGALMTRSVGMQIYQTTFADLDFGRGTALAYMLTLVAAVLGIAYVRSFGRAR
ncbi:MAG: sugar ABC transporter permease [Kutzneria sp.]|nr:sugar ABC transporter permease [Kutzneria sp.]MBV9846114.1 sugar ABC transporter permease [Kutzneria sp.]